MSKASRIILIVVGNLALVGLLVAGFFWFEKREVVPGAADVALSDDSAGADESDDSDEPSAVKTIGQWSPLPAPKPSDPNVDLQHWHGQVGYLPLRSRRNRGSMANVQVSNVMPRLTPV